MAENCYMFVDTELPESEQKISVLCVDCRKKEYPNVGWFWNGSERGYGPWAYNCIVCNKDVSKEVNEETETPI